MLRILITVSVLLGQICPMPRMFRRKSLTLTVADSRLSISLPTSPTTEFDILNFKMSVWVKITDQASAFPLSFMAMMLDERKLMLVKYDSTAGVMGKEANTEEYEAVFTLPGSTNYKNWSKIDFSFETDLTSASYRYAMKDIGLVEHAVDVPTAFVNGSELKFLFCSVSMTAGDICTV